MSVATTSLITVDEYLIFLGEGHNVKAERRAQAEQGINWASIQVEDYLGRTLISGSSATEIFDGFATPHPDLVHFEYVTQQAPIIASPTPKLSVRSSSTWSDVTATTYTWDATDGVIYFTDGNFFAAGRRNYRIVYDYGYADTASVPNSIKQATCLLTKFGEVQAGSVGIASAATGDGKNKSYTDGFPPMVKFMLNPYIRA